MREKIKIIRHIAILFLTVIIFSVGVFIGGDIEQLRVQNLYTQLQEQDLDYQNIVTESNYIDYLVSKKEFGENSSCDTIKGAYFSSIDNLDKSRLKLESYINTARVKEEEYQRLRDHYSNLQINYWVMANRISNLCEEEINTILFFFSEDKKICPECEDQGVHLTYVKQKLKEDVLIFSLDAEDQGPISLVSRNYDVGNRELPVLIINEETFGFKNNEELFNILNISFN